jgi:hypothetical protein
MTSQTGNFPKYLIVQTSKECESAGRFNPFNLLNAAPSRYLKC